MRVGRGAFGKEVRDFRQSQPGGTIFLGTEYHKGKGPSPLRVRPFNRQLSVLGAAEIYSLIEEKRQFMTPALPVVGVIPKGIRSD